MPQAMQRAVIFAHFDAGGQIPPHTRRLIDFLHRRAQKFILVSTGLNDGAARTLPGSIDVIVRDNVGHDFMSYKAGWLRLSDTGAYDEVVIANDSIYLAEPARLEQALARLERCGADAWALTGSQEHSFHLQSFFIGFGRRALQHPALAEFWAQVEVLASKDDIIRRYERGLSARLRAAGLQLEAAVIADRLPQLRLMAQRKAGGRPFKQWLLTLKMLAWPRRRCNPMHFLWDDALMRLGIMKLELLKRNPRQLDLGELEGNLSAAAWQRLQQERASWQK